MSTVGLNTNENNKILFFDSNLQLIFAVTLMSVMGVSSITPALPQMADALGLSKNNIGLLITAFTIPGALLTPVLGVLSDRYGRKLILVPALFLFGFAGGGCTFAGSINTLLMLRFLQGIGGAALSVLNVTLIGDIYSDRDRIAALGYNSSILQIGAAGYPVVGGALAMFGWNYPFILSFVSVLIGLLIIMFLKDPEIKSNQRMKDYLSDAAASLGSIKVIGLLSVSIITFIMFYGVFLTYFPVLIAAKFNASPLTIGIIVSSMSLATAITAFQLNRLIAYFRFETLIKFAFIFYGLGLLIIPFVTNIYMYIIPVIIFGFGHGLSVPCILNLLTELAPAEYRAAFLSVNGMLFRLGQTIGPIVMGIIYSFRGIHLVFFAGVVCTALAIGVIAIVERKL